MKIGGPEYQRAQYAKHREKRLAAKRAAYWADTEKMKKRNKQNYDANREKLVKYAREYRAERREELAAKAMERYYANHPTLIERRKVLRQRPEARAKAYAAMRRWLKANPDKALIQHAKRLLAEQTGFRVRDIPNEVAEAKVEQLKITRWVREQLAAQAGEAGTAETTKIGSVHEHAVRDSECAQKVIP